jgi:hypothetical protein
MLMVTKNDHCLSLSGGWGENSADSQATPGARKAIKNETFSWEMMRDSRGLRWKFARRASSDGERRKFRKN